MSEQNRWWVYMVQSRQGKLYTGISTDVERRFAEHQQVPEGGKKGAKFFRSDPPKAVVYRECCADRSQASRREAAIKKLSRKQKLDLLLE
jgi:putative endonuclease